MSEEQKRSDALGEFLAQRELLRSPGGGVGAVAALDRAVAALAMPIDDGHTVLAIGGYGRGQLWFHSDIDLLILHRDAPPKTRELLYPLWDAGLRVGHATRTVRATLAFAADDPNTLCSILDARLLAGSPDLLSDLNRGLPKLLSSSRLVDLLAAEERALWRREPFQLQDFDLKNGRGGLRTHHRLHWDRRRAELLGEEALVPELPAELAAVATLASARHAIHAISKRPSDLYPIELRPRVGEWLGRDPLEVANEVYRAAAVIDGISSRRFGQVRPLGTDPIQHAGLTIVRSVRSRWSRRQPAATPLSYARSALGTVGEGRLTPWEFDLVSRSGPPDWSPGDRSAFLELLAAGQSGWTALSALWEAGWLTRAIPELAHLRGLAQAAPFHRYSADAHMGATVAELVAFADEPGMGSSLGDRLGSLDEALLTALLHDVGKGLPGDHSQVGAELAHSLLGRIGFDFETATLVSKGIRHHLLLPDTAQRRDIADPSTAAEIGALVGNLDFLALLTMVSVADGRATSAEMSGPWKESLLFGLFDQVVKLLDGSVPLVPTRLRKSLHQLVPDVPPSVIDQHLEQMPAGYLVRLGPETVAAHLRLVTPPPTSGEMRSELIRGAPVSTLLIATRDRPGLLATVAGVLALHNLSVLEARVATRADGVAIDSFRIVDARGQDMVAQGRWPAVRESLERALKGEIDLATRLAEKRPPTGDQPRVRVEGNRIEIRAADRAGLLHDWAAAFHRLGLDVVLAKIDTRGAEAIDVFEIAETASLSVERLELGLGSPSRR